MQYEWAAGKVLLLVEDFDGASEMAEDVTNLDQVGQSLQILGVIPFWVYFALAVACGICWGAHLVPTSLEWAYTAIRVGTVFFGVLAIGKLGHLVYGRTARHEASKTFHLAPSEAPARWCCNQQADGTYVTQICADFLVFNRTDRALGLVAPRLIKRWLRDTWPIGEVLPSSKILIRSSRSNIYGTTATSNHQVPPQKYVPIRVVILVSGQPHIPPNSNLNVTLAISDDNGAEQQVELRCIGVGALPPTS